MSFVMISQESKGIKPWCPLHPCAVISLPDLFLSRDMLTQTGHSLPAITICSFSFNVLSPLSLGTFSLPPHAIYSLHSSLRHLWAWPQHRASQRGVQGLQLKLTLTRWGGIKHLRVGNQEPTDQHQRNLPEKGQNFHLFSACLIDALYFVLLADINFTLAWGISGI